MTRQEALDFLKENTLTNLRLALLELPEASHWLMTDSSADCIQALQHHLRETHA